MDTEQNMKHLKNYVVRRPKTSFSARFSAYFQILHSLPDSVKNSMGAESQNPGGTDHYTLNIICNPSTPFIVDKPICQYWNNSLPSVAFVVTDH